MLSFSLDWNCVIAVEKEEQGAESILGLVQEHIALRADVSLLAVSALENTRDHQFPKSVEEFGIRVENAGLGHLPVLPAPMVIGLSFFGYAYIPNPSEKELEDRLWDGLFPGKAIHRDWAPNDWPELSRLHREEFKVWRNARCDIHNLLSHLHHRRDVFVTANTKDFQRHWEKLRELGIQRILTPRQACALIEPPRNLH